MPQNLTDVLRSWLLGEMHIGRVSPGDRLPSIREVSRTRKIDHRAVADAYADLQAEGLVEVRGRSGVYVTPERPSRAGLLAGRRAWMEEVLAEAWKRRITPAELSDLVLRSAQHGLRCACIDATEDHAVALAADLAHGFGMETRVVRLPLGPDDHPLPEGLAEVEKALAAVDLVVTTVFHCDVIAPIVARAGLPMLTVAVNPALRDEVQRRLDRPLTLVVADPQFLTRTRTYMRELETQGRLELLLAENVDPATLAGREDVLLTRAARRRLGMPEFHLLDPSSPFIAPESARALANAIVSLALAPRAD